jgi:hypothetical protein
MSAQPLAHDSGDVSPWDLGTLLLAVSGPVPDENVNWSAFHTRLSIQAKLPLARLRHARVGGDRVVAVVRRTTPIPIRRRVTPARSRPWWQHAAQWSRVTVGSALAASVVLVAVIRLTPKESVDAVTQVVATATATDAGATRAAFESAIVGATRASRIDTVLMPSAAELLIPLANGVVQ